MGTISTTIELYDKMSGPMSRITANANNMASSFNRVDVSADKAFNSVQISTSAAATGRMAGAANQVGENMRKAASEQERFNNSVNRSSGFMGGLGRKVTGLVSAFAGLEAGKALVGLSDEIASTTARLDQMNAGFSSAPVSMQDIYNSAQNARGEIGSMASLVARFGTNARDAFSSGQEVVDFANLIQKQMTLSGASTEEASGAMLQLSQALGSGVLRGDELNSIFEQAPSIINTIAEYLNVPVGEIRNMASEGQLTADIVKNAMFDSADKINKRFAKMPMTWNQVGTMMKNAMVESLRPALAKINEIANSDGFQRLANNALNAFSVISVALFDIVSAAASVGNFIADHWSIIAPIVLGVATALGVYKAAAIASTVAEGIHATLMSFKIGVTAAMTGSTMAATAAQMGYNGALYACPIVWILIGIIAIITAIYLFCSGIAKATGIAGSGFSFICGCINVVIQFFYNLYLTVANIFAGLGGAFTACGYNLIAAFHNAISSVKSAFYSLLSVAMGVISKIAAALSKLPFVEFDAAGLGAAADGYAEKAADSKADKMAYKSISGEFSKGFNTNKAFGKGWIGKAFKGGTSWGDGVMKGISSKFKGGIGGGNIFKAAGMKNAGGGPKAPAMPKNPTGGGGGSFGKGGGGFGGGGSAAKNLAKVAGNTDKMLSNMEISKEDLKYLRDIAERHAINRYTANNIKIELTNNNSINSDMDIDGVVEKITLGVQEAIDKGTEGVH